MIDCAIILIVLAVMIIPVFIPDSFYIFMRNAVAVLIIKERIKQIFPGENTAVNTCPDS